MKGFLLSAIVLLVLAACGQEPISQSPFSGAVAGPAPRPCVFPNVNDLALLAYQSDVVAVGSVDGAEVVHYAGRSTPYTRHTVHVQTVLRGTVNSKTLTIEEIGGVPVPVLQPGPYVVFLAKTARADGLATYFLADGLNGAFPLRAKGVVRECPSFPSTEPRAVADGGGVTLSDFSNQIRNLPTITVPHK